MGHFHGIPAAAEKRRVALVSVGAAAFLVLAKVYVGLSTNSLGILSDALHSLVDLGATILTFLAVLAAGRPPDEEHPYGHGRIENLSALAQVLLVLGTTAYIMYEAYQRLVGGDAHVVDASPVAFLVMGVSIAIDIGRTRALRAAAHKHHSPALAADALHFTSDLGSSIVVVIGLGLTRFGYPQADALAAVGVAMFIVFLALRLWRQSFDALMDRAPAGLGPRLEVAVGEVSGVVRCERLRIRQSGSLLFVDVTVDLDRTLPFERSHEVTHDVERRIHQLAPNAEVLVHANPVAAETEHVAGKIKVLAARDRDVRGIHHVALRRVEGRLDVEAHLEVDRTLTLREAHEISDRFEAAVMRDVPEVREVTTHLETVHEETEAAVDVTEDEPAAVARIREVVSSVDRVRAVKRLRLDRGHDGLLVLVTCTADPRMLLIDAHALASRVEDAVRAKVADVDRIVVHVEPA
ncbi:MAG: cation-efflux pump [Methanobacteriota archaeon]